MDELIAEPGVSTILTVEIDGEILGAAVDTQRVTMDEIRGGLEFCLKYAPNSLHIPVGHRLVVEFYVRKIDELV